MRPLNLKTKIFLDSGDPEETREAFKLLGFLDGQTTNPTLVSKNPEARQMTREKLRKFYKKIVQEVSEIIPEGSVSIEVYADFSTSSKEMLEEGRELFQWIPNAYIKFPTTAEGLKAAELAVREGLRINMTLCFSQAQAAAVYAATKRAGRGQVFISPFAGRLDDRGENGMDLIANIIKMYKSGDGHVEVLTASVRNIEHIIRAIQLDSDILTAPLKVLKEWTFSAFPLQAWGGNKGGVEPKQLQPFSKSPFPRGEGLKPISYQEIDLNKPWQEYEIHHELTDVGIEKFSADWNSLIKR